MLRQTIALTMIASLAGCTLAPPYVRPGLSVTPSWPTPAVEGVSAGVLGWREVFQDRRLQAIIELALVQNRDLRVAIGNIQRARAQYRVQRAELLPAIGAVGSETHARTQLATGQTNQAVTVERDSATIGVSAWELDLFGRIRSLTAAAQQSYFATEENRRTAQISLIAEVASDYLTLAADQDVLKVIQDTLKSREAGLSLAQKRFDAGATSELDLRQAQTLTEQARSDAATAVARVGRDRNALMLVVGAEIPEALLPEGGVAQVKVRGDLPPGLPSDVLIRRPDVLSAEHRLQAENANIGAARAAFFPRISLTGSAGAASTELGNLFSHGAGIWSFTPQIVLPLFAGGANLANLRGAQAGRDIAVAQYERAIQVAFREISDALAVSATINDRVASQQRLVDAAAVTQRLTQARYDSGVDSYLSLLDAQRTYYAARQTLLTAELADLVNRVALYRALGGGGAIAQPPGA